LVTAVFDSHLTSLYLSDRHVSSAAVKPMLVDTGVFALEKRLADRCERDRESESVTEKGERHE